MTQKISMAEMYDIASAFILDKDTNVRMDSDQKRITYTFTKYHLANYPYCLVVEIPRGAPQKCHPYLSERGDGSYDVVTIDNKNGCVYLKRGTGITGYVGNRVLVSAQTRNNVGRAFDKNQRDIVRGLTRLRSPSFFNIYELAKKRTMGQVALTDNNRRLFGILYRIREQSNVR